MKIFPMLCVVFALVGCVPRTIHAQTPGPSPTTVPVESTSAGGKRTREFQGDELGQVLRLLARQARINLVIDEAIKGTVDLHMENLSAMETLEAVVLQHKLTLTKRENDIYYVAAPEPMSAALDFIAKPETTERLATFERNYYNALLKAGFSSDDAIKLVVASDPWQAVVGSKKKPLLLPAK